MVRPGKELGKIARETVPGLRDLKRPKKKAEDARNAILQAQSLELNVGRIK